MAPVPPSWHAPLWAKPGHELLHHMGGGAGGGDGAARMPQSVQSVPYAQMLERLPGPPSMQ